MRQPQLDPTGSSKDRARVCEFYSCGVIPFERAWAWQQRLVCDRIQTPTLPDVLILTEHAPVYTLGQGANPGFLKFDPETSPFEVHRIERGGEVTYHCPGQIVGYPILNLRHYQQDLHWYLRQLEEVIIRVLALYGIQGERIEGLTGVWVNNRKVAALGIKVSRWITMHGFSLNVCPDLSGFERIVPCGICDRNVGSLSELIPAIKLNTVHHQVATEFSKVFNVTLQLIERADGLPYG